MTSTTAIHESRKTKAFYQDMSVQVFAGMALGALIGWLFDGEFASHSSTYAGTGTVRYTW